MDHTRAVASICASIVLFGALLLVPRIFAARDERINLSASPVRGEYYFVGQAVPDTLPDSTEWDESQGQPSTCQRVADWARRSGVAPINNDVDVRIQGPVGTDITVLDVIARIADQHSAGGPVRVRCPELVHDQIKPDYQVDFAQSGTARTRPPRQVSLRATDALCALPIVSCGEAALRVAVSGVEHTDYRYYLQITYLAGREKRTSIVGDTSPADPRMRPLRTVIERDRTDDRYFGWEPQRRAWVPAAVN